MQRFVVLQRVLRILAIAIAVLAVIDPSISSQRRVPPVVAVVGTDLTSDLATDVSRALESRFTVVNSAFAGADATVLLDVSPADAASLAAAGAPLIAVVPSSASGSATATATTGVQIAGLHAPAVAQLHAPVRIDALVEVAREAGDSIVAELRQGGTLLDRIVVATSNRLQVPVALSYTPRHPGGATLTVLTSLLDNENASDFARLAIEARDDRSRVLFYDARPSWMSTFVRRTLEADGRFDVSSRTATSRNLSTSAGSAPSSLSDAARLAQHDVIVVGAPDALSASAVAGVETYLRRRGGAVVLLFDAPVSGNVRALLSGAEWSTIRSDDGRAVVMAAIPDVRTPAGRTPAGRTPAGGTPAGRTSGARDQITDSAGTPSLRVAEAGLPRALPAAATSIATIVGEPNAAVLFDVPVGAGRLIVSTAFDAWRFRDPDQSRFEEVWPSLIASAAASALRAIDVTLTPSLAAPGEHVQLTFTARDIALGAFDWQSAETRVSAAVTVGGERRTIRVYPSHSRGTFHGSFVAPHDTGAFLVAASVTVGGSPVSGSATLVVDRATRFERRVSSDLLTSIAISSGGAVIESSRLVDLAGVIDDVAPGVSQRVSWHPMRSPWWILPFAFLLGAEWWLRRRGGRP